MATNTIYTYMAILVGLGVGFVVRFAGKGVTAKFGLVGAILALFSCVLGNFLTTVGFIASNNGLNFFEVLFNYDWSRIFLVIKRDFEYIDLVFYGLAVIVGYGTAFHTVKIKQ